MFHFIGYRSTNEKESLCRLERWTQRREGTISTDSGVLTDTQYSFSTRLRKALAQIRRADRGGTRRLFLDGTLGQLGQANLTAESIRTTASVTLEKLTALCHH